MVECELCGKELDRVRRARIEGSLITVCENCAGYGEEVEIPVKAGGQKGTRAYAYHLRPEELQEFLLVEGYPERIRIAREKLGLNREDFGKKMNEKKAVIDRLESGRMRPSEKLTKKLERILGITLREQGE